MKRRVLSTLLAFIMTLSLLPGTALAASSGTCGDSAKWTLNSAGVLTISGTGNMNEYYDAASAPWYDQRGNITAVVVSGIKKIGLNAFSGYPALKNVTIGDGVTSVGDGSFRGCVSLESISFGSSVTYIGKYAFQGCVSLPEVTIPNTLTKMEWGAFSDCSGLTSVTLKGGAGIIGYHVFENCTSLTSVNIPVGVTKVGDFAFNNCASLKSVILPKGLIEIGQNAFAGCKVLSEVELPATLTSIGPGAFMNSGLQNVDIPGSVSYVGYSAFQNCTSLTGLTIGDGVQKIGWEAFSGCTKLASVTIPGVSELGVSLFAKCRSLTSVVIKDGPHSIPSSFFNGCTSLKTVYIPASVGAISALAFYNCDALADVHYAGTETQWNRILIDGYGENESNDCLRLAVKHYSSQPAGTVSYTVKFDSNVAGASVASRTYKANDPLGTLPTPTRTGYKFSGWYTAKTGGTRVTAATKVTADMTLYAHWTKNTVTTYTITLNANGGTVSPASLKVESGKTYYASLPTPARDGYKFDGWYTTKTGTVKITAATKATANRTIYAHWTEDETDEENTTHLVTFNANGGVVLQRYKAVVRSTRYRDLPTPTRAGYHFLGWYTSPTGGTKVTSTTRVTKTADHTLYARWTKTAPKVQSTRTGSWTVYIPSHYKLPLYTTQTTAVQSKVNPAKSSEYAVKCTKMVTLSNGTVRYYGNVGGVNRWFQYTCEMDVD